MIQDLRFAFRMIASHRWFSAAVIATLALGIGINTTVFTLVNAVLFKPVPIPGGERLVTVYNQDLTQPDSRSSLCLDDYLAYKAQNRTFDGLEAGSGDQAVFSEPNNPPERYSILRITPGLFGLLQTPPLLGRGFSAADGQPGAPAVVLIGHTIWQKRYGGAADVVGHATLINGAPATIVGVMPAGFQFPSNADAWTPIVPNEDWHKRTSKRLVLFGLLKPGVTLAQANSDLALISSRLASEFPDTNKNVGALVRTFHQTYNGGPIKTVFLMMLGAVAFVLLIACANVANMMLGRAIARARELAVRAAMGASRWQLVRQLLVESVVLSTLGGLLGFGLTAAGVHAFDLAVQDVGKPYWVQFGLDYRVFAYFAAISILSGIVFGLMPALRASRVDLNTTLKDGAPSGGSSRGGRLAGALVVFQFALTVVLLAGAGMMMRGFFAAQSVNPFVRPASVFTARLQLPEGKGERYEQDTKRIQFYENLLPRLAALPGVTRVAVASHFPGLGSAERDIEIEGQPNPDPKHPARASMVVQSTDYLSAIGLPLLTGRGFEETDGTAGREAAVVTRAFAAKHWPNESAVGKRFRFLDKDKPGAWTTVIGISADIVQDLQGNDPPPVIFISSRQQPWGWMGLLVRTSADPTLLAGPVRAAVQSVDPDLPLFEVRTLPAALDRQRWFLGVFGTLFTIFAFSGLLMAAVGIYGVIAQATARRTREIGIRMALGATALRIMRLVLSRGVRQLGLGLVLGLGGAFFATHLMAKGRLLVGVSEDDPVVFVGLVALLVTIGLFACWLPARRAAALHPVKALREE